MERVPYRRIRQSENSDYSYGTTNRYNYRNTNLNTRHEHSDEEQGALGETLILQGIISGVILVAVILISMLTFPAVEPLQNAMRQALSGPTNVSEVAADARQFGAEVLDGVFNFRNRD